MWWYVENSFRVRSGWYKKHRWRKTYYYSSVLTNAALCHAWCMQQLSPCMCRSRSRIFFCDMFLYYPIVLNFPTSEQLDHRSSRSLNSNNNHKTYLLRTPDILTHWYRCLPLAKNLRQLLATDQEDSHLRESSPPSPNLFNMTRKESPPHLPSSNGSVTPSATGSYNHSLMMGSVGSGSGSGSGSNFGIKFDTDDTVSMLDGTNSASMPRMELSNMNGAMKVKEDPALSNYDAAEAAVAKLGSIMGETHQVSNTGQCKICLPLFGRACFIVTRQLYLHYPSLYSLTTTLQLRRRTQWTRSSDRRRRIDIFFGHGQWLEEEIDLQPRWRRRKERQEEEESDQWAPGGAKHEREGEEFEDYYTDSRTAHSSLDGRCDCAKGVCIVVFSRQVFCISREVICTAIF